MKKYKLIDLFSGVGGITQGFHWAGFETLIANEFDKSIANSYQTNFPDTNMVVGDVRDLNFSEIMIENKINPGDIDVIAGGPPCQGFSMANRKRIDEDERNLLFLEFVRAVKVFQPKCFLIENVMGMKVEKVAINSKEKNIIDSLTEYFYELGYRISFKSFKSEEHGVPQMRRRVIVIGTCLTDKFDDLAHLQIGNLKKDFLSKEHISKANNLQHTLFDDQVDSGFKYPVTVWEAISDLPQFEDGDGKENMDYLCKPKNKFQKLMRESSKTVTSHISTPHSMQVLKRMKLVKQGENFKDLPKNLQTRSVHSGAYGRLIANYIAPTITTRFDTPSTGRVIHPFSNRTLTVREAARLQSFPDSFNFVGNRTSQGKQIGNAVPPLVAKAIGEMFIKDFLK